MPEPIANPRLTLAEAINVMGVLMHHTHKTGPNPVLESAWEKLREVAHGYAMTHPEELEAVQGQIDMERRFTDE